MERAIFNIDSIKEISWGQVRDLKQKALGLPNKTIRLCLHKSAEALLHEMIIIHSKETYTRPHKHRKKTESFHIIEGSFFLVIFNQKGRVTKKILISDQKGKGNFLCRIDKGVWHMIVPVSDFVVFHEVTDGPYTREKNSIFASWAPDIKDTERVKDYVKSLLDIKERKDL